ncbi:MAG: hypothetical protein ACRELS_12370 [Candidatus Rokuibacteriota bacterium]
MRRALVLVAALATLGCASDRWTRDGASETQLTQETAECERRGAAASGTTRGGLGVTRPDLSGTVSVPSGADVMLGVSTSTARTDAFERCMAERGWRRR